MLQLRYIQSPEVTFHLDAKLMQNGSPGSYVNASWLRERGGDDPFTPIGNQLIDALETLSGLQTMYGQFGFMVQAPEIFTLQDVLWDVLGKIKQVLDDDIRFATTLGDDAFTKPAFITNPSRAQFVENIDAMLIELRQRNNLNATIDRLSSQLEQARHTAYLF